MPEVTTSEALTIDAQSLTDAAQAAPEAPVESQDAPVSLEDMQADNLAPVQDPPGEQEPPGESATPEGEPTEAQPTEAPPTDVPPQKPKRDYSKYPPEKHDALKKMSNVAFAEYEATYDAKVALEAEVKDLKSKADPNRLPDNYYEHEEGYTLSPQYREAAQAISKVETEANFVRAQLRSIREGKPFFLPGYDKDGRLVPYSVGAGGQYAPAAPGDAGIEPTEEWKDELSRALMRGEQLKGEAAGQIRSLQQQFKAEHEQAKTMVFDGIKQLAPWSSDKNNEVTKWAEEVRTKGVPKPYQNHPMATAYAHTLAWGKTQQQRAEKAEKALAARTSLTADSKKAPPVPSRGKQPARTSEQVYTIDSFRQ